MEIPQWVKDQNLTVWLCVVIGGVVLALLAAVLYFVPSSKVKIPAVLVAMIVSLAGGFAMGVALLMSLDYHWEKQPDQAPLAQGGGGGGMMGGGGGMMGGMMGGGGGMMGGPPPAKTQLGTLVRKLDQLTNKPFNFQLKPEAKKVVAEQLKGLSDLKELSNDDATKRIDAVKAVITKDEAANKALAALGFTWPGEPAQMPARPSEEPNPFKDENLGAALVDLQKRMNSTQ